MTATKINNKTRFISFEGIEGSGKTTQIQLLSDFLTQKGKDVLCLREPGGTDFGEGLRSAVLNSHTKLHPLAEAHLFAASRAQLLYEKILPHLEKEQAVVLVDRYIDSSFAYQGVARGLGIDAILEIHQHSPLNFFPHKTFYLQIPVEESLSRQHQRGNEKDYFEKEESIFHQQLIQGFNTCLERFSERIIAVDGMLSVAKVHHKITGHIQL